MAANDGASSINVTVRVRPFTIRETAQLTKSDDGPLFLGDGSLAAVPSAPRMGHKGLRSVIKVVDEKCLIFDPPEDNPVQRFSRSVMPGGKRAKDQTFAFDRVFDDNTTQADVYEATTKNLLDSVLDGYNATVFAYGATGCGKTHTITGTAQAPGIIFLTMQELFEKVDELQTDKESEVTLSYLEIYNETIRDLLNTGAGGKQGLMLREDANQAVSVAGLSSHKPQNVAEVMDMVIRGNANRTQSPTEANATSSRSHAVLQVNISLKDCNASVAEPLTMATLSIIDLAGSERASATKNRGERLLEGANINKSLLALGSCINALCDPRKKNHVPYRNSKLTRLLKFSLGGNCRTVMIVCVSPSSAHFDETQNTLRYANRAKNIQTKSVRNVYNVDRHVKDYLKKIDEQMLRINELTAQQKQYEELAFVKFRKAEAKRAECEREGLARIRAAYEHSTEQRKERASNMRRLRQIERRIGAISGWIGAFDQVCETREDEEPPASLAAMRKTAQGILVELEGSRQHYHQRLAKDNWTRAIDTALQDGLRQLQSLVDTPEGATGEAILRAELEALKLRADTELHQAVLEQERGGEAASLVQVLLTAHFETVAILSQILVMSEADAVQTARDVLGKVLKSCTEAAGQVIKPDGGLQITEAVSPTRHGTPRKRRQIPLMGPSPLKSKIRPAVALAPLGVLAHVVDGMQHQRPLLSSSPAMAMASPRRRVVRLGGARKGVAFSTASGTPLRKKSSAKKRVVRWRDDAEDGGPLVEFQATPKPIADSSPVDGGGEGMPSSTPTLPECLESEPSSSPLPTAPVTKSEVPRGEGPGRFAAGFLAKKLSNDGSPPVPLPPNLSFGSGFSSEDDVSPLREMAPNSAPRYYNPRSSLRTPAESRADAAGSPHPEGENAKSKENADMNENGLDSFSSSSSSTESEKDSGLDRETAAQLRSAMKLKRTSSLGGSSKRDSIHHRRRSPTATSRSPPPPAPGFSASHARRMVRSEREDGGKGVLSPRSMLVAKAPSGGGVVQARRSMIEAPSSASIGGGLGVGMGTPRASEVGPARGHVRVSSVVAGSGGRGSSMGGKAVWR